MAKKFKHPVVQWAHEHPLLFALFGTTIFFYAPARLIGKTIRTAKYGDSSMGNIPGLMNERSAFTGSGTLDMHQLGAIPAPSAGPMTEALFSVLSTKRCVKGRIMEKFHENMSSTSLLPSTTS